MVETNAKQAVELGPAKPLSPLMEFKVRMLSAQSREARSRLLHRLHSDLQTHLGNMIDKTDPGGQFS